MNEVLGFDFKATEVRACASCRSKTLDVVFDFGNVPLAGYFPLENERILPLLPMKLMHCENCELFQISPDVPDEYLFSDYRYISSIGMQSHFNELADWFIRSRNPRKDCKIVEFGCNDGPLLQALTERGFSPTGIDPASNIVKLARNKGLQVIDDFFNLEALDKHGELRDVDFFFSSNSFAHISDIHSIADAVSKALAPEGIFIVEVQSIQQMFEKGTFDFIYHEHKYYYSVQSMSNLLSQFGLRLIETINVQSHGGSIRMVFQKTDIPSGVLNPQLERVSDSLSLKDVSISIDNYIRNLSKLDRLVQELQSEGKRIAAFGASGRANMLLGFLPLTRGALEFVVDESPERAGRLMAQNNVPIIRLDELRNRDVDVMIILAWNFTQAILSKLPRKNYEVIVPLPSFESFIH